MSKKISTNKTSDELFDEYHEVKYLELSESEVKMPDSPAKPLSVIKLKFEELSYRLFIKSTRALRAKILFVIWRIGFLKGNQSELNNKFIAKFIALSINEQQPLLVQTKHSQLVPAFNFSNDIALLAMLSHWSEHAANMVLTDILHNRFSNKTNLDDNAKSQAELLNLIEHNSQ